MKIRFLVVVLSVALIAIPAMGLPTNPASVPIGSVLQVDRVHKGVDISLGGAAIYDGDRLETDGESTLRARLGGSQMYLREDTLAEVHGLANGFSASLMHGTVVVSSRESETFQLLADGATIRPVGAQVTIAEVTWVSPTQLLLTSTRGAIQVTLDDDVKTIEAGNSYRMEIGPDDPAPQVNGSQGPPHPTGRRRKKAIYFWIATGAAVTGIVVWRALESPSAP